jgi:hypothetical protein
VIDAAGSVEDNAERVFAVVEPLLPIQPSRLKESGKA